MHWFLLTYRDSGNYQRGAEQQIWHSPFVAMVRRILSKTNSFILSPSERCALENTVMDPLINVGHQGEELKQYMGGGCHILSSRLQTGLLNGRKFNQTMASYVFSGALFNSELDSYPGT